MKAPGPLSERSCAATSSPAFGYSRRSSEATGTMPSVLGARRSRNPDGGPDAGRTLPSLAAISLASATSSLGGRLAFQFAMIVICRLLIGESSQRLAAWVVASLRGQDAPLNLGERALHRGTREIKLCGKFCEGCFRCG